MRALAVTVSNRAAAGVYEDRSGPVLADLLRAAGCVVDGPVVVPDGEPVAAALRDAVAQSYDVVVTTGGTGLTPLDLTPEMTRRVLLSAEAVAALRAGTVPKGDALAVARIAGIAGAKRTPDLIPLCHPIGLHGVNVEVTVTDEGAAITAMARTADRTGVEMEALTAVAVAGLALIDMVKAIDPAAVLSDVRVEWKEGGKTGRWQR